MGVPSMPELLVILVIILLLFGAKKIPDLASGLGKGIKNFKKSMSDEESTQVASNDKIEPNSDKKPNESENKSNSTPSQNSTNS
jgi:sec-independent protein translocase protein TatA